LVSITSQELDQAVSSLQARAESFENFSENFVETNVLQSLKNPNKNQIIYGRRGTGKTHLLGRLKEYYRDTFDENGILPIFIDGRTITDHITMDESSSGIAILIIYRRFIDAVLIALEDFLHDSVSLSRLEKFWPSGNKKDKIKRVNELLADLKKDIRLGEVEIGLGAVDSEHKNEMAVGRSSQIGVDVRVASQLKTGPKVDAAFIASLSKVSSQTAEESMVVLRRGLTVLNFNTIGQKLGQIVKVLEPKAVIILLDEWSAIELDYQPLVAEMVRSTILSAVKVKIKFGCIPFLTRMSAVKAGGQTIGFPIGEEVFVDVDLDRIFNAHADPASMGFFLLKVLQKHLGISIRQLLDADFNEDIYGYFSEELFQDDRTITELVLASAGVPRDFLRIFSRAYQKNSAKLPITEKNVRLATHEFFQDEKKILIQSKEALELYEDIFNNICLPAKTYFFFVTQKSSRPKILEELWHHRLLHLIYLGVPAFSEGKPGTYDVYVFDYGRYIQMAISKKGQELLDIMKSGIIILTRTIEIQDLVAPIWEWTNTDNVIKTRLTRALATSILVDLPKIETLLDDCSALVADSVINAKLKS
jgi:hypothetical protein